MGFFSKFFGSPAVPVSQSGRARFAVIDTETTGLDPRKGDRIIELAAVTFDARFKEVGRWESLIHPGETPVRNSDLHGVTEEMLVHAPAFGQVYRSFANFIDGTVLIAHNAPFDAGMLDAELSRIHPVDDGELMGFVDSIDIASQQLPKGPYRLSALLERLGLENPRAHSAAADAAATGAMLAALFGKDIDLLSYSLLRQAPAFDGEHAIQWGLPMGTPLPRPQEV